MNEQKNVKYDNPQAEALGKLNKPRVTDEDCAVLRPFKGNEDLLLAVRNLFIGFELSEKEKFIIKDQIDNDQIKKVIKKMILPELEPSIPIGQNMDLWMTKDISDIQDKKEFELVYSVKNMLIEMIKISLERLDDVEKPGLDLSPKKDLAFLKARIGYINHTTAVLQDILMNASRPIDETNNNQFKNSNK